MSRFFDYDRERDECVDKKHEDYFPHKPAVPHTENGGVSNEAYLNDYRNRMPFHYIEEGSEGYYYWQYGSTMEIEFEISDEIAFTEVSPDFVVDVQENGESVVNKQTGVANIVLGSMAKEDVSDYYTVSQMQSYFSQLMAVADAALSKAREVEQAQKDAVPIRTKLTKETWVSDGPPLLADSLSFEHFRLSDEDWAAGFPEMTEPGTDEIEVVDTTETR